MIERRLALILLAMLVIAAGCSGYDRELLGDPEFAPAPAAQGPAAAQPEVEGAYNETPADSLAMFDDLGPYGSWYDLRPFGPVWRPTVVSSWQPMQSGYWVWTAYGWMWASYDPFGWATYHYGYWVNDFTLGWVWVPGYDWAPVRCDWMTVGDYVCWAPLPPPGHGWHDPWADNGYDYWTVVPATKFRDPEATRYRVSPEKFKSSYHAGDVVRRAPDTYYVQRETHNSLDPVPVQIDKEQFGRHELRRVIIPGMKQTRGEGGLPYETPAPLGLPLTSPGVGNAGGSGGSSSPGPQTKPVERKKTEPRKYKAKDSGKKSGNSKGESKDNGNDGGKSKDNNSGKSGKGSSGEAKKKKG